MQRIRFLFVAAALLFAGGAQAQTLQSRFFVASDGVRLHYIETGPSHARTLIFIPGWTMPAWIWGPQLAYFARNYHVVAFDPRGQGDSDIAARGYEQNRRSQDIAELGARVDRRPALIVAWSLGVLDTLAYVHTYGDSRIAGLVLVDNSIGEDPAPLPHPYAKRGRPPPHDVYMRSFVRSMFRRPQSEAYLESLTEAALRTPEFACRELLSYPVPRTYWREAVYSTGKPILYAVRPEFAAQAENLAARHPSAEIALYPEAGHALFVDEANRFNIMTEDFITRRIWP